MATSLGPALQGFGKTLFVRFDGLSGSSRSELGHGLSNTYFSLAQALATSNMLHKTPRLVSEKRAEAMKFEVPEGSLILTPLQLFLNQSSHVDEHLLTVMLRTGGVSSLALRQQQRTTDLMQSIRKSEFFRGGRSGEFIWGKLVPEHQLYQRLKEHIELLSQEVTELDRLTRDVMQMFINLATTTGEISKVCSEEKQRLLDVKAVTAGNHNWLSRVVIDVVLNEPEDLAQITRNIKSAVTIHEWALDVLKGLEQMVTHLRHAVTHLDELVRIIRKHKLVRWKDGDKSEEPSEFLAQIMEGVALLEGNNVARTQLLLTGLL